MKKKIAATLLVMALVLSMGMVAFAAAVDSIESGVFVSSITHTSEAGYQTGAIVDYVDNDYAPGDTINIYLNPSKFVGGAFTPETGMSTRELERAGIQLRTSGGKNSKLIQNVSFQETQLNNKAVAYIQVKLVTTFAETEAKDFETTVTLYANKQKAQSITVGGSLSNRSGQVGEGEDYISLEDGTTVEAVDNVAKIEVNTGNKISIIGRMYKGRQYYAVSDLKPSNDDIKLMDTYKEMEMVINLHTKGFEAGGVKVKMDLGESLFAYGEDGTYLGKTTEELELRAKYYLLSEKIDWAGGTGAPEEEASTPDEDTPMTEEPADDENPPADDDAPTPDGDGPAEEPSGGTGNIFLGSGNSDIPDTGIGTGVKVAVGAGALAIVMILVAGVTRKKKDNE